MIYRNIILNLANNLNLKCEEICREKFSFNSKTIFLINDQHEKFLYIFVRLEENEIHELVLNFQTELYVYLKDYYRNSFGKLYAGFEKNTTLIVFTESETHKDIYEYVEEDSFYFKKQIIYLNQAEIEKIEQIENDFIKFINSTIINQNEFNNFQNGIHCVDYTIASKFYEKIPFLSFDNKSFEVVNIADIINTKINFEEFDLLNSILNLSENLTEKELEDFIND